MSLNGIIGMVAGHPYAHTVSLARWSGQHLSDSNFRALLSSLSQGSRSRRRNVPVQSLSFRGWGQLSDGNVAALLDTMQHLM